MALILSAMRMVDESDWSNYTHFGVGKHQDVRLQVICLYIRGISVCGTDDSHLAETSSSMQCHTP